MSRFWILLGGYTAIAAIAIPAFVRPAPRLVWNASASVPLGLYAARPARSVPRGALVAAYAPAPVAHFMAVRRYLPLRVPMLKQVAAIAGQRVCRAGTQVTIDGKPVAEARSFDRAGRPLSAWHGCRIIAVGEVFLLNPASLDSFDGRYFGPVPERGIVAVLTPLWTSRSAPAVAPAPSARPQTLPQANTKGAI